MCIDAYVYIHIYIYMCGNTAYRAIEPLKITAREIPSPWQPYAQEKFMIIIFVENSCAAQYFHDNVDI